MKARNEHIDHEVRIQMIENAILRIEQKFDLIDKRLNSIENKFDFFD